jgi:hypothetical protein
MNYELAKKLKDAGFVFKEWYLECHNGQSSELQWDNAEWEYPTLSELIEACGDRFELLERKGLNQWHCRPCYGECKNYSTPEEAVANLWLKLQNK